MKVKWIVITKSIESKEYCCFNDIFNSKKEAQEAIDESKQRTKNTVHDWKKTKIFPINWSSIINRRA